MSSERRFVCDRCGAEALTCKTRLPVGWEVVCVENRERDLCASCAAALVVWFVMLRPSQQAEPGVPGSARVAPSAALSSLEAPGGAVRRSRRGGR